jgi:MFS family permease
MKRNGNGGMVLVCLCLVTGLHYAAAYMRIPIIPLYAISVGADVTQIGLVSGLHTLVAGLCAIPVSFGAARWGRRGFVLGGTALGMLSSFLIPIFDSVTALVIVYVAGGLAFAAFTPSAMSLTADVAAPGYIGRAYGWYTAALYVGTGAGPLVGGYAAQHWDIRQSFFVSGALFALALALAFLLPAAPAPKSTIARTLRAIGRNPYVWGAWIAAGAGWVPFGMLATYFPLIGRERGLEPLGIGLVFGIQALANAAMRWPSGWLLDQSRNRRSYILMGLFVSALLVPMVPLASGIAEYSVVACLLGVAQAVAFVGIGATLAEATTPEVRGVAMGGYLTSTCLGIGVPSIVFGPVVKAWGYETAFVLAGSLAGLLVAAAGWMWSRGRAPSRERREEGVPSTLLRQPWTRGEEGT